MNRMQNGMAGQTGNSDAPVRSAGCNARLAPEPAESLRPASKLPRLLAWSPAAMKVYRAAENALGGGELSPRQREQIALTVAEINGCAECVAAHVLAGKGAGLTDAEVSLAQGATGSDTKSNAMLAFTLAVVLQRGDIKNDHLKLLRDAGFPESQIIEIIANIALNIFTNYLNIIFKSETKMRMPKASEELAGKEL